MRRAMYMCSLHVDVGLGVISTKLLLITLRNHTYLITRLMNQISLNIIMITMPEKKNKATKAEFISRIKSAFRNSKDKDLNFFLYCGHGGSNKIGISRKGLGNWDYLMGRSLNTLFNLDKLKESLSYSELLDELMSYKGKFIVIIDACESGSLLRIGNSILTEDDKRRFLLVSSIDEGHEEYRLLANGLNNLLTKKEWSNTDGNKNGSISMKELIGKIREDEDYSEVRYLGVNTSIAIFQFCSVELKNKKLNMNAGDTSTLEYTIKNKGRGSDIVCFVSSDNTIASVSKSGQVNAHKAGTVTITAYIDSGGRCLGSESTCKVVVKEKQSLSLDKTSITLKVGDKEKLNVTVHGMLATPIFKSSNKKVATVSSKGRITAKKVGTATITVAVNGLTKTCYVKVNRNLDISKYFNKTASEVAKMIEFTVKVPFNTNNGTIHGRGVKYYPKANSPTYLIEETVFSNNPGKFIFVCESKDYSFYGVKIGMKPDNISEILKRYGYNIQASSSSNGFYTDIYKLNFSFNVKNGKRIKWSYNNCR